MNGVLVALLGDTLGKLSDLLGVRGFPVVGSDILSSWYQYVTSGKVMQEENDNKGKVFYKLLFLLKNKNHKGTLGILKE